MGVGYHLFGEVGNNRLFAWYSCNNVITCGEDADQLWITVTETPNAANTINDFPIGENLIEILGL